LENNTLFIETAEKFIEDLDVFLKNRALKNSKPKKDRPEKEVLKKILIACENYDMDGVDAAMEEFEAYEYESDNELAAWLRENVDQVNFAQIIEKLSALCDN
jgi:hypothetical protein